MAFPAMVVLIGITLTYVGNTLIVALLQNGNWDHPHIRGEHTKQPPAYRAFKFRNDPNFFNLHSSLNLLPSNQPHYTNFTTAKQAILPKKIACFINNNSNNQIVTAGHTDSPAPPGLPHSQLPVTGSYTDNFPEW